MEEFSSQNSWFGPLHVHNIELKRKNVDNEFFYFLKLARFEHSRDLSLNPSGRSHLVRVSLLLHALDGTLPQEPAQVSNLRDVRFSLSTV